MGALVLCCAGIIDQVDAGLILSAQICDSKKVSTTTPFYPTMEASEVNPVSLPAGEREILRLVAHQVLMAVSEQYPYEGYRRYAGRWRSAPLLPRESTSSSRWRASSSRSRKTKTSDSEEWDILTAHTAEVKRTKQPPKHTPKTRFFPRWKLRREGYARRRGHARLVPPATPCAAILEKLVETGFVGTSESQKIVNLIPRRSVVLLSPSLRSSSSLRFSPPNGKTPETDEYGETSADDFIGDITAMVDDLVKNYEVVKVPKFFPVRS